MAAKRVTTAATTKPAPKPVVATAPKPVAAASPAEQITDMIARRDLLSEQHDIVQMAPRPFAEAELDIAKTIELLAGNCRPSAAWLAQGPTGFADLARQLGQADADHYAAIPAASVLAWAAPELLADRLREDLAQAYQQLPKPMSSAARATELAKLNRDIASLENEIAGVFWQAVDAGMQIDVPPVSGATLIGLSD